MSNDNADNNFLNKEAYGIDELVEESWDPVFPFGNSDEDVLDDGWQTINSKKKKKKKDSKLDTGVNGDSVKKIGFNRNSKSVNSSVNVNADIIKNDSKPNYNRSRNKKNRNPRKFKNDEYMASNNNQFAVNSDAVFELNEEELRWDNLADIEGGFEESGTNSAIDGFCSEDDVEFPMQSNDDSYQGMGVQLTSQINTFKMLNDETFSKSEKSTKEINSLHLLHSKFLNECLAQQLPIFGKFSMTEPPKSLPIIPSKPVSFASSILSRNKGSKLQYTFGFNVSELLNNINTSELKFLFSNNNSISKSKQSEIENLFNLNLLNTPVSPNNTNFSSLVLQTGLPTKKFSNDEILNTVYKQQQNVAYVFSQFPVQNCYPLPKSMNLIPTSNSKSIGQSYPMSMHSESLTHQNQECVIQNPFPASINMPVPFHLNRK